MKILIVIACLITSVSSAFDLEETAQTLREQAWENEYIPESTVEAMPLTEYEEFEVVELFRAETIDELEASLTDGYPYPWLEETLRDESIPWEDRYWLDCRVRAEIAQDLQLFFNEDGEPVRYEADRIRSGEDYWRECFVINPPGQDPFVEDPPEGYNSGVGLVVDHFGNEIGEIAISNVESQLSRDGSVGVTETGIYGSNFGPGLRNLCFFYPDGSYIEYPMHHYIIYETISQSGELVGALCSDRDPDRYYDDALVHKLLLFDREANLLFEKTYNSIRPTQGRYCIAISPNDEYVAVALTERQEQRYPVYIYSTHTGELLFEVNRKIGTQLFFSPNSDHLCISGGGAGVVVDCETGEIIWSRNIDTDADSHMEWVRDLYCTNNATIVYWLAMKISPYEFWPMLSIGTEAKVISDSIFGRPAISPNGYFYVAQRYLDVASSSPQETPFSVSILRGVE